MPDGENQEPVVDAGNGQNGGTTSGENQEPVVDAGNGQNGGTTSGENQGTGGSDETPTEETFPSFRKAYKYKGGFDKFVYDTLKKLTEESDK